VELWESKGLVDYKELWVLLAQEELMVNLDHLELLVPKVKLD